jgi:hypothetical protein
MKNKSSQKMVLSSNQFKRPQSTLKESLESMNF